MHIQKILSPVFLIFFVNMYSQTPDTAWGNWHHQPYYNQILSAPVLLQPSPGRLIELRAPQICFDRKLVIQSRVGDRLVSQCLFINTADGFTGVMLPSEDELQPDCRLNTADERFHLTVAGLRGNVYTFRNRKRGSGMEHLVTTGNTHAVPVSWSNPGSTYTLYKRPGSKNFCDNKLKGIPYKYGDTNGPVFYLFGREYPDSILVSNNKYLGSGGVGYQITEDGLYLILELESPGYTCSVLEFENSNNCFDPNPFKIAEEDLNTKMTTATSREREKLKTEEARAAGGDCPSEQMAVVNHKKQQLDKQEERMREFVQTNTFDNQTSQMASVLFDHIEMTQLSILENKVKICQAQKRMSQANSQRSRDMYQQRINCLTNQNSQLESLKRQLQQIDEQHPNDTGKAQAHKATLYTKQMPRPCN